MNEKDADRINSYQIDGLVLDLLKALVHGGRHRSGGKTLAALNLSRENGALSAAACQRDIPGAGHRRER